MIFAFLLFEGIVGSPRKLNSAFPSFPSALRRSIQKHADVGHMLTHYSSSCPYSNANRCNIAAGTLFSRSRCEWLEYFEECDLDGSENCQGFFRDQKNSWSMKWETCDDKVIASIRSLLDWAVGFDRDEKGHGNSCLPMTWHGPETCNYPESRGPCKEVVVNQEGEQIGAVIGRYPFSNRRGGICAKYLDFESGEEKQFINYKDVEYCPDWF